MALVMTQPEHRSAGSHTSEPLLSVAAVARRLGVAPATLRTWDRRYGLGPSGHTVGRHRKYGPRDVARLELMQILSRMTNFLGCSSNIIENALQPRRTLCRKAEASVPKSFQYFAKLKVFLSFGLDFHI